jgi:hypothetical protein
MAFALNISFDNTHRLKRRTYYFDYKGQRFKLVQDNPNKWADHLLTVVENGLVASKRGFAIGAEYLRALAWELRSAVAVFGGGSGYGWPDSREFCRIRPGMYTPPRLPPGGIAIGYDPTRIAEVTTDDQRRALAAFREATAANNDYLRFLFFYQVLDVGAAVTSTQFIDDAFQNRRNELQFIAGDVEAIDLRGQSLGEYLKEDCRHALAHFVRYPGLTTIDLDDLTDRVRITRSARVVEEFARFYLVNQLRLTGTLYLVRPRGGGFPLYVPESDMKSGDYEIAYPYRPWRPVGKAQTRIWETGRP